MQDRREVGEFGATVFNVCPARNLREGFLRIISCEFGKEGCESAWIGEEKFECVGYSEGYRVFAC